MVTDTTETLSNCGICKSTLDNPKTLPCLHSFCLRCLKKLLISDAADENEQGPRTAEVLICPTCGLGCPVPSGSLSKLPTICVVNRLREQSNVQEALESTDTQVLCTSCDGPDAWEGKISIS